MADRYSTITREVPVERERNTVYPDAAPAVGDLSSQHRVSLHPAGFRVRERGALEGTVVHAYRCPVHGLVDVRVPRSDVPDVVTCESSAPRYQGQMACCECLRYHEPNRGLVRCECGEFFDTSLWCGSDATWAGSQCGQGWAAGECKS